MNFLEETIEYIKRIEQTTDDIIFIGSEQSGHSCEWEEFTEIADLDYDDGYGSQKIATDLIIVFKDGSKMWRGEYDGAEGWDHSAPFNMPENKKKLLKVMRGGMWESLEDIHQDI